MIEINAIDFFIEIRIELKNSFHNFGNIVFLLKSLALDNCDNHQKERIGIYTPFVSLVDFIDPELILDQNNNILKWWNLRQPLFCL